MKEFEVKTELWLELAKKAFTFASNAQIAFLDGDGQTKKEILLALSSYPKKQDRTLSLTISCWLAPIEIHYPPLM